MTGRRSTLLRRGPAALALALLTACSAGPGGGQAATAPPAAQSTPGADAAAGGSTPLVLEGRTIDGAAFDAADLTGRPAVLWFWTPWCTICRAEAPEVAEVAAEYAGRVAVVGVAGHGDLASMRQFVSDTGTGSFPHLADEDGALWNRFGVVSQPAFVFVDRSGGTEVFAGSLGGEDLRARVDHLDEG